MTDRYGYLGPEATFTEAALIRLLEAQGTPQAQRVPMRNAEAAFAALAAGELDGAVVPIENSVEGGVPATLDALSHHTMQICAETLVDVRFVVAVRPGTRVGDIRAFATHPHAEAQTRVWVSEHIPGASYLPASSTAAAAQELAAGASAAQAAICPALAARRYGLEVLAADVGDHSSAVTRFVLVRRRSAPPARTGADKTTLVVALATDEAGALLNLLEQFSARGVNLSRIESRPTGDGLGLYQFSIDAQGHVADARMAEALAGVHRIARRVQFLGSYPAANASEVRVDPRTADAAYAAAHEWLGAIRGAGA
ncbi:prephenate dehydratase [Brevibacterium sp. BRM-1]|uniref:prephenate dehydratase n=1 Tax=Brevibacterium sp. BRM-1 TaxID=2999062 RepID=UPI00227FA00A|nr:prephenate dehydratase [Brevibacterium sp. BRM-1]WAL39832.1 prephenate dehydratase [Brevibacterium sp. BRM-1]